MSEKTVHKSTTPHGYSTPHKYPSESTSNLDKLDDLAVQLYPTGRAWHKPEGGKFDLFHKALNLSFVRLIEESNQLINGTFPDNEFFTDQDASLWEYRLGLITNEDLDIEIRKKAISRKIGHPNNLRARQGIKFIEDQLRSLDFDVYIHENLPPYVTPLEAGNVSISEVQHRDSLQHGDSTQHGGDSFSLIANSIEQLESFAVGEDNLWATFFIGGPNLGDIAQIPLSRLKEFKELVIKLKPAHLVAFTFINFV